MEKIYSRTSTVLPKSSGFCPGCLHGTAHSILGKVIEEEGLREETIGILPIGCSTLGAFYWDLDVVGSAHGRAPAVATGVKRCNPNNTVFTYQGDGDLASIGLSEIIHAANRGENFTSIFVNNNIYGMTGGQAAPTTLIGQKSTTTPFGRSVEKDGYPMDMCNIISQLKAPVYVARFSLDTPKNIIAAKKGIQKAIRLQNSGKGFTFIEIMSNCPTNWGMSAVQSIKWMQENSLKEYPLGIFVDKYKEEF